MYSSTLFLTSALDGVGGQRHAPARLPPERHGTHHIGGWVGPRDFVTISFKTTQSEMFQMENSRSICDCGSLA
jgi:hypothetical protein